MLVGGMWRPTTMLGATMGPLTAEVVPLHVGANGAPRSKFAEPKYTIRGRDPRRAWGSRTAESNYPLELAPSPMGRLPMKPGVERKSAKWCHPHSALLKH